MVDIESQIEIKKFKEDVSDVFFLKAISSYDPFTGYSIEKMAKVFKKSEIIVALRMIELRKYFEGTVIENQIPTPF